MAASNETGGLKDEMTGLDLYSLAQGIDLGNFSGCDNFLYKCLPKIRHKRKILWVPGESPLKFQPYQVAYMKAAALIRK